MLYHAPTQELIRILEQNPTHENALPVLQGLYSLKMYHAQALQNPYQQQDMTHRVEQAMESLAHIVLDATSPVSETSGVTPELSLNKLDMGAATRALESFMPQQKHPLLACVKS